MIKDQKVAHLKLYYARKTKYVSYAIYQLKEKEDIICLDYIYRLVWIVQIMNSIAKQFQKDDALLEE